MTESVFKRKFNAAQRAQAAQSRHAMPGGRYPIESSQDLRNALDDYNRTGQDPEVLAHLRRQAKRLQDEGETVPPSLVTKDAADEELANRVIKLVGERLTASLTVDASQLERPADEDEFLVLKALDEKRYTFGPLYAPDQLDAHSEFATADELQSALHAFARAGDYTLRKQHDRDAHIGDVVEQVAWPYETEVDLKVPGRDVRKATLPAGTVYMGVIWSEEAWPLVKSGAISGYSLGGRAVRVKCDADLEMMRKSADASEG